MSTLALRDLPTASLRDVFGLGVAGNFTGHLEQAGEAADFTRVVAAADMPKGIFPWYAPGSTTFLGAFPLSSSELAVPVDAIDEQAAPVGSIDELDVPASSIDDVPAPAGSTDDLRLQVEPEVGLLCDLSYDDAGRVTAVVPRALTAFDDCSIRRAGATRISHKKNWGTASKGVAARAFVVGDTTPGASSATPGASSATPGASSAAPAVSSAAPAIDLASDGPTADLRLACFLRRDGETHAYGVDSPLPGYSLHGRDLLDWLVDRLREQRDGDGTPLEDVGALLRSAGADSSARSVGAQPSRALIGIGATRYEPYGETTFVRVGDETIVVVYDAARHESAAVAEAIAERRDADLTASVLRRTARAGAVPPAFT